MQPKQLTAIAGAFTLAIALGAMGGSALTSQISHAADTSATPSTSTSPSSTTNGTAPTKPNFDPTKGGHTANGKTETILTGDTAEKVKAAALAANPGGTIQRVETDAEGDTYEAHMTESDGSPVTVKLDASFKVTKTEDGPMGHGRGGHADNDQPAQSTTQSS